MKINNNPENRPKSNNSLPKPNSHNRKPNSHNNSKSNPKKLESKQEEIVYDLKCYSIEQLYDLAIKAYQAVNPSAGDRWDQMMVKSGTKKDRIAVASQMVLQHPEGSLRYFDMLIKFAFDNNPNFALQACEALSNVFIKHVFSEKSCLRVFVECVQEHIRQHRRKSVAHKSDLIGFYLENEIKQYYSELIKAIQILMGSELTHIKKACLKILGELARFNELRRTVLSLIINKLGDADMEVVNQVTKCLKKEFYDDLLSSETLLEETERFLFRQGLAEKAQFFVINFLNNINLKFVNEKSMSRLFEIFYHFFSKCLTKQEDPQELSSRLFLNSIKGLNRIFSHLRTSSLQARTSIENKIESVYKVIHSTENTKAKIQLLLFLFQAHTYLHNNLIDRYYRVLYECLQDSQFVHCSLAEMFFDIVLVSIRQDENAARALAMCKRMLQLCFSANSNFIITTLLMLDKVLQANTPLHNMLFQAENFMREGDSIEKYDILKREPKYANADRTCAWELRAFGNHYHPTVRKFAQSIIEHRPIQYEGSNPLLEFSLTAFTEKMSLRKLKKSQGWKMRVRRNLMRIRSSKYETLLNKPLDSFTEDEQFIKEYLERRGKIHRAAQNEQDIDNFADQVIEQQMDRLNPNDPTLPHSQQSEEANEFGDELQLDEHGLESDEDQPSLDEDELELNGDEMEHYDVASDEMGQESNSSSVHQQKQFEDVFDEMQDLHYEPPVRSKPIGKQRRKPAKECKRRSKKGHPNLNSNHRGRRKGK